MAVKMPLGLRIAIIDRAFRRKMDEWAEEIGITAVQRLRRESNPRIHAAARKRIRRSATGAICH